MENKSTFKKIVIAILCLCLVFASFGAGFGFAKYVRNIQLASFQLNINGTNVPDTLEITKAPDKTEYNYGDKFDPTGIEVTIHYTDGTTAVVDSYTVENADEPLTTIGQTSVIVSYTENDETKTAEIPITVNAKIDIRYEDGGNTESKIIYTLTKDDLDQPTREGYTFDDWYIATEENGKLTITDEPVPDAISENMIAAAKWTPVTYTITYNLNGGTQGSGSKAEYTVEDETFNLPKPTQTGYKFDGWYESEDLNGDPVTQITTGSTGNKTFYAKWTVNNFAIGVNQSSGGNLAVSADKADVGATVNLTAVPDDGYTYTGCTIAYIDPDGNEQTIELGANELSFTMPNGAVTITPKWEIPMLAANSTWYSQGSTAVKRASVTSIDIVDSYNLTGKTIVDQWDASTESTGADDESGPVTAYIEDDGSGNGTYRLTIAGNGYGRIYANPDSSYAFSDRAFYVFDYTGVDFFNNLTSIFGISILDTSNAINLSYMFSGAGHDVDSFIIDDLSDWNTGSVTDMYSMFAYAGYSAKFFDIGDLSNWDTSKVTTLSNAFFNAGASAKDFNIGDLGHWDTSNVTNMAGVFWAAGKHATTFSIGDLSNWNTSKVTSMKQMFAETGCDSSSFDIGDLSTKEVTIGDKTYVAWDVSNVKNMGSMFFNTNIIELNIGNWNTSNVKSIAYMFMHCDKLANLDVSSWNTGNVTDMSATFANCSVLPVIDVEGWNTSKVTNMHQMFQDCKSVTELDVSNWDTSNVTDMALMFQGTTLTELDLSSWDTHSVKVSYRMFFNTRLKTIYVSSKWNMGSLQDGTIEISEDKIISSRGQMFYNCPNLVGGAGTAYADNHIDYSTTTDDSIYAQIDGGTSSPGYLTNNIFLSYEDVEVGSTVDPVVTIKSKVFAASDTAKYELADAESATYASVDASTGVVTGLAEGTATVKVTLTATNGDTITAEGTVKVGKSVPILAANSSWFTNDYGITRSSITEITIKDSYTPSGTAGTDYYAWDASAAKDKSVMAYVEGTKLTIAGNGYGRIYANPDSSYAFSDNALKDYFSVKAVTGADKLDTSNVTNMRDMFWSCKALTTLDVSNWDVGNVTNMRDMFRLCKALTTLDVSNWDVGNVTNMYAIFSGDASNLMALQTLDVSNWDVSNVTDMTGMFNFCSNLTTLDVSNWNVSEVTTMYCMFQGCSSITKLDVSNWETGNCTNMNHMFYTCTALESLDVSNWKTGNVTTFYSMFGGNNYVGDMKFTSLAVENWDTSSATDMGFMFYGCGQLTEMDLSKWDVQKVTSMTHMFADCFKMTSYDFSDWNTTSLTSVDGMFNDNSSLVEVDVSDFDTGKVIDFDQVFENCHKLQIVIGLDKWDTSNSICFQEAFKNCYSLKELDLSFWDTSSVVAFHDMFSGCSNLETIYVSNRWNTDGIDPDAVDPSDGHALNGNAFNGCSKLVGGAGTAYADNHIDYSTTTDDSIYAQIDGGTSSPGYLTNNIFLSYEDVEVGSTVDPVVTIKSKVFTDSDQAVYEIVSGSEFIEIDTITGQITGKSEGTATVKVTLTANNGDTISAESTIKVFVRAIPQFASGSSWYKGNTTRPSITSIQIVDSYTPAGTEIESWDASAEQNGSLTAYVLSDGASLVIAGNGSGTILANKNSSYMFSVSSSADTNGFINVASISGLELLDTGSVTNMGAMFRYAGYSATTWNIGDLSGWDTSKVTNMTSMFHSAGYNATVWSIGDLSGWDTSKVTDMTSMFCCAGYSAEMFNLDLSDWDTSSVTIMSDMFSQTGYSATEWTIGDLSDWNTSSVTTMAGMFYCTGHNATIFELDLSDWDTRLVTSMYIMFYRTGHNATTFTLNLSGWNTSSVTNMGSMFHDAGYNAEPFALDLSGWDTSKVTNMTNMFAGLRKLKQITIGEKFSFTGDGSTSCVLPTPSASDITGATGKWYLLPDYTAYAPANVEAPTTGTYTYVAVPLTYTVAYNANGGSGTMASQTHFYGTATNLTANAFIKENYFFSGWSTAADGNGTTYADEESVTNLASTQGAEVTLYAQWIPARDVTINHYTLDIGGATWTLAKTEVLQYPEGATVYPPVSSFENRVAPSTKAVVVKSDGSSAVDYYYELTQFYIDLGYNLDGVAYSNNGNSNTPVIAKADLYINGVLSSTNCNDYWTKHPYGTEYKFVNVWVADGYSLTGDNGKTSGTVNGDVSADFLLKRNSYIVEYNANGGSGTMEPSSQKCHYEWTLPKNTFEKEGYAFAGWSTTVDGEVEYTDCVTVDNLTYTDSDTVTLYAVWTEDDGSTGDEGSQEQEVFAVFSADDYSLSLYNRSGKPTVGKTFNGKTASAIFTGFDTASYTSSEMLPWYSYRTAITNVIVEDEVPILCGDYLFSGLVNCQSFDVGLLNTENITSMRYMFGNSGYNSSKFEIIDINKWDVGCVEDMSYMFEFTGYSASNFLLDLNGWDVSSVKSMLDMFSNTAYKSKTVTLLLNDWDTSSVTNMRGVFYHTGYKAISLEIYGVEYWCTDSVTNMISMFSGTGAESSTWRIGDLSTKTVERDGETYTAWDTGSVTNMGSMFFWLGGNASNWSIGDISNWDVSSVTNMHNMFYGANRSSHIWDIGDLSDWDVSSVTDMSAMFHSAGRYAENISMDLSKWNTCSVVDMSEMFYDFGINASSWSIGNISGWDTSNVTYMKSMFYEAGLNADYSLDLSRWNVDKVTSYGYFNVGVSDKVIAPNFGSAASLALAEFALPENIITGETITCNTIPDTAQLIANAESSAPTGTALYGWLVDSGMAQQVVLSKDLEAILLSVYGEEPEWEMTLTPLYQTTKDLRGEEILATAISYVGYEEGEDGYTTFGDHYDLPYEDWCAMFVSWCLEENEIESIPISPSCAVMLAEAKEAGLFRSVDEYIPAAGDIVVFDYQLNGQADHVGFVDHLDLEKSILHTVEGNYDNAVAEVNRTWDTSIVGYIIVTENGEDAALTVPAAVIPELETDTNATEPSTEATEATEPSTEATEATQPSTEATEATQPSTEATEATQPSTEATEATEPSTEATEATQPSTEAKESTEPSTEATESTEPSTEATEPAESTEPTQAASSETDPVPTESEATEPVAATVPPEPETGKEDSVEESNPTTA